MVEMKAMAARVMGAACLMAVLGFAVPGHAQQISDAQVCINPVLIDGVIKNVQAVTIADVDTANPVGMDKLIISGMQLKALINASLVSRTPGQIVCRYDSVWSKAAVPDVQLKFIIVVKAGANGSADVDAHLE